jgi:hypothetical protein
MRGHWAFSIGCAVLGTSLGCASARPAAAPKPTALTCTEIPGAEQLNAAILVMGELHGTVEMPAQFGQLVCAAASKGGGRPVLVGLEVYANGQAALDAFLDSDGGPAARQALLDQEFWRREYQDGRSSVARLALIDELRRYRAGGVKLAVRALDPAKYDSSNERDAAMAATLVDEIESLHPVKTLVLIGDVHARTLNGYPWDASAAYVPFAARLKAKYGAAVDAVRALASGGSAWTCGTAVAAECGVHPLRTREIAGPTPRVDLDPEAAAKTGFIGTLLSGTVTPSLPARPDLGGIGR